MSEQVCPFYCALFRTSQITLLHFDSDFFSFDLSVSISLYAVTATAAMHNLHRSGIASKMGKEAQVGTQQYICYRFR